MLVWDVFGISGRDKCWQWPCTEFLWSSPPQWLSCKSHSVFMAVMLLSNPHPSPSRLQSSTPLYMFVGFFFCRIRPNFFPQDMPNLQRQHCGLLLNICWCNSAEDLAFKFHPIHLKIIKLLLCISQKWEPSLGGICINYVSILRNAFLSFPLDSLRFLSLRLITLGVMSTSAPRLRSCLSILRVELSLSACTHKAKCTCASSFRRVPGSSRCH